MDLNVKPNTSDPKVRAASRKAVKKAQYRNDRSQFEGAKPMSGARALPINVLSPEAREAIELGIIPDLEKMCEDLFLVFLQEAQSFNAIQFMSVFQKLNLEDASEWERFKENDVNRYVLVQNRYMKVVLIHWRPGEYSSVHGHPDRGCLFKVLQGKVEEKRYHPGNDQEERATCHYRAGSAAYIDDRMAYHAVGNPFGESAISLHAYVTAVDR